MASTHAHDKDIMRSTAGTGATFSEVMERRLSRRAFLKSAISGSLLVVGPSLLAACSGAPAVAPAPAATPAADAAATPAAGATTAAPATSGAPSLGFTAIQPTAADVAEISLPEGYRANVLLRWGDPLTAAAPEFDINNLTRAAQEQQFGYNCDYVGFLPLPVGSTASDSGLLVVNHEYTNPELMFAGYNLDAPDPSQEQVDVELAAHGLSVVEIMRGADGSWAYNRDSQYNRRYTGFSPMAISGPAAGHEWLMTGDDATGTEILGTLNNCSGGNTPWGTVVTAEENFHQYFANLAQLPDDDPRKALHDRYGIPEEASERRWENFYPRFDVAKEPNEPFRFGWAVELDPYDASFVPVKRTSLGRFRHEAQTFVVTPSGKVAVYTGDDARFEYVYKFVTAGSFNTSDRTANRGLLDDGVLYVARFNEDGSGEWLPLVFGQGPLTEANGFSSQADVLVKTRLAADALGATKMDRPEDIETNPVNKKVYMVMTSNTDRGKEGKAASDKANPRPDNKAGHIIEVTEAGDDHAATTFSWEIFLLCGDPADESTFFADFPRDQVSPIANPDNINFDKAGNLWIATDGQGGTLNFNDGFFAVPVTGPERGRVQQFFASVAGSEVCGPEFTPDNTSLFLAIQHPGEGGTFDAPLTSWPGDTGAPRPSVVVIQAEDGRAVGAAA